MKAVYFPIAIGTALYLALTAHAQNQPAATNAAAAPRAAAQVAVVDIGEIFQKHPAFTTQMESLKQEVQAYEKELEEKGKAIMAKKQELDKAVDLKATPNYKIEEEKLARMQADLAVEAQGKRKNFIEREAQLYYDTYRNVQGLIEAYARQFQIQLVLRFNRIEMKAEDRATILQGVNRPVVFYDAALDITDVISNYLQRTAPAGGGSQPTATRPRAAGAPTQK